MRTYPLLLPAPDRLELTGESITVSNRLINVSGIPEEMVQIVNRIGAAVPPVSQTATPKFSGWRTLSDMVENEPFQFVSTGGPGDSGSEKLFHVKCSTRSSSYKNLNQEHPESYQLIIGTSYPNVQINAPTCKGAFYGLITLGQLLRQYGNHLPTLTIDDEPSFRHRGVMLDISRDRVPLMDELNRLVDLLASWKINHLQLYTEHTFAYQGHERVWQDASPVTPDEIRSLDQHCQRCGITLAANQNCFGHMQRWLKHKPYAALAETHGEWDFNGEPRFGAFSLCPVDRGSTVLIRDLLSQLLPCFSSGLVNIGCDETFDVGKGRSKSAVEKHGLAKVYADFVSSIVGIAREKGFRSMVWADMLLNNPQSSPDMFPEDIIHLVWDYEPDARFEEWCDRLTRSGRECWVCPGTSSWRSITGRNTERKGNFAAAVKGLKAGATGFMVTEWGDMGYHQQAPITLSGLAEAAHAAWNAGSVPDYDSRKASLHCFGDANMKIGGWLEKLGDVDYFLRRKSGKSDGSGIPTPLRNSSCLFRDLHSSFHARPLPGSLKDWQRISLKLDEIADAIPVSLPQQLSDELHQTLNTAKTACGIAILRRDRGEISSDCSVKLVEQIRNIVAEHKRLWLLRCRLGGLQDSCGYYDLITGALKSLA